MRKRPTTEVAKQNRSQTPCTKSAVRNPLVVDWLPYKHLTGLDAVGDSSAGEGVLLHLVQGHTS